MKKKDRRNAPPSADKVVELMSGLMTAPTTKPEQEQAKENHLTVWLLAWLGNSCLPGLGFAAKMHDGNDEERHTPDLINDPIGKPFCAASPRPLRDQRPSFRILDNPLDGSLNVLRKLKAESFLPLIIKLHCLDELCPCGCQKLDFHLVLEPI
jgi:hypothetical protein